MTRIVVLDGHTLNPGDLSWASLEKLGEVKVYERTPPELIVERALEADIVLTNKTPLTAQTIARLPKLRYIGVLATGYNIVDGEGAAQRGIPVTNVPDYSTDSVAQLVFALLLELTLQVKLHSDAVHEGEWTRGEDFSFTKAPLLELSGRTFGILGFGRIGQQVAKAAAAFGMKVIVSGRQPKTVPGFEGIPWVPVEELFATSDVLSLHCPLTPQTEGIVNGERLNRMKRTALLLNTSRGGLIVERDLADALNEGRIAGAGLDVLSTEPPEAEHPLLSARNCLITPHIAWATVEARIRLLSLAADNVGAFLAGTPRNVVNGKV
ncbi:MULTISPECIES: D-2-hydroxyacid dehydrogenase [Paenibacillus]|uniref:D-2-hydroxyacid dehydrogenase n=1 Tax=Paenibacillus TaxID=44249 RepID=UPI0022B8E989|nr:D-2-hydroxyacid dehydrogenase [Paenibacillus caseinilyticus]MCZ8523082.1 D-2-hydroxyacid dehydrogenase [Paenibacillus caseinilyticus]